MKKHFKLISIILIFTFLSTCLPANIGIVIAKAQENVPINTQKSNEKISSQKVIGEIIEKREKNVKYYLKDDKTYEAVIYPEAVHYKVNGKWEDIDNTLSESKDEKGNDVLQNKSNSYKVKLSKDTDINNKMMSISKDKFEVSWSYIGSKKSIPEIKENNQKELLSLSTETKAIQNTSSIATYKGIQDDIDIEYQIKPEMVKEYIVLNKQLKKPVFQFKLDSKGLIPEIQKDNSIIFYDENNKTNPIFTMQAPYMYDTKNEISNDIKLKLDKADNEYILTIEPDKKYLEDNNRVYPVVIDPTVVTTLDRTYIYDNHVSENYPNNNYRTTSILETGYGSATGKTRTYIKFTLPANITAADMVTNAQLKLSLYSPNPNYRQVDIHESKGDWNQDTLTWNNQPGFYDKVEDYQIVHDVNNYYYDITGVVKKWYTTGNNYGIVVKHPVETSDYGYNEFYSSEVSDAYAANRPYVIISYINNSGLESYFTYHSQQIGRGGTGYVNDYNGNVIYMHNDLAMSGNKMPITINHIYNSNDKNTDIGYGPGWRLNLSQRIIWTQINGVGYYKYIDEDGTQHYFENKSGTWKDDSGLDLVLSFNTDGTYTIKDKNENKLTFTPSGYLWYITDRNGNQETLHYNGATLVSVTDGIGRTVTLNVLSNNYLVGITDPSGITTNFSYNGVQLSLITYPDGKQTNFTYDSNNNITSAKNIDGYTISYGYYSSAPYRVKTVSESNGSTLGQQLNISYEYNTTKFTDINGKQNIYQFNNSGNTICVQDNNGDAVYYKYDDISNVNKLTTTSKVQKVTTNYIKNHNAEYNSNWSFNNDNTSTGSGEFSTAEKYIGLQSLKVTKTNTSARSEYQQFLTLEKGKTYTFSGYIKTSGVSNVNGKGAHLLVHYKNNAGAWCETCSDYASGTNDWRRYEVTFTIPSDASSGDVILRTAIVNETGAAYYDCMQLEDGTIANRYNLVENSDFNFDTGMPLYWSGTNCDSNDTQVKNVESRNVFRFNGVATNSKNIYQTIKVSGNTGDVFSLGGWAKGQSVQLTAGRYFGIDVGFVDMNGNISQWEVLPFNEDSNDWQYASTRLIAKYPYKSVNIYALYYNNANTAYFDNLQLYKEEFGSSYQYDSNGNIISTSSLASQNSNFTYNGSNDLITTTDPKGNKFNYTYDNKHNILTATTAQNVVYSFTYDNCGNPLTSKVGDTTLFMKSQAVYTQSGNYLSTLTDSSGNSVTNNWNETKGILNSTTDSKGKTTSYSYNPTTDDLTSVTKTVDGNQISNSYTYDNDKIKTINSNTTSYSFGYDALGNNTSVNVGTQSLITNTYEARTSKLL